MKQVILNQFEQNIQTRYRFDLDRICPSSRYFARSISLLVALRMINANSRSIEMILQQCLETMPCDGKYDLIDYVKYAVSAADSVFDRRLGRGSSVTIADATPTARLPQRGHSRPVHTEPFWASAAGPFLTRADEALGQYARPRGRRRDRGWTPPGRSQARRLAPMRLPRRGLRAARTGSRSRIAEPDASLNRRRRRVLGTPRKRPSAGAMGP